MVAFGNYTRNTTCSDEMVLWAFFNVVGDWNDEGLKFTRIGDVIARYRIRFRDEIVFDTEDIAGFSLTTFTRVAQFHYSPSWWHHLFDVYETALTDKRYRNYDAFAPYRDPRKRKVEADYTMSGMADSALLDMDTGLDEIGTHPKQIARNGDDNGHD